MIVHHGADQIEPQPQAQDLQRRDARFRVNELRKEGEKEQRDLGVEDVDEDGRFEEPHARLKRPILAVRRRLAREHKRNGDVEEIGRADPLDDIERRLGRREDCR
jgi:hypothetical protein